MSTRVTWQPSTDAAIYSYVLQSSPDAATWSALATIVDAPRSALNANYNVAGAYFFYTHAAGTVSTWYRLAAVDTLAQQSAWSASFQAAPTYVPAWWTAGDIVNAAAVEVGLTNVADPFASTDSNIKQLCWLLKSLGKDLVHMRSWNHLRKEYAFTTVAGQSAYGLPADYHNMIDQTWWNRTNRLPLGGPLSAQEWQYLKARLYPDTNTPAGYDIAFEYNSAYWVSHTGAPDTTVSDTPTLSTDYVWFDPLLMIRGLKLAFLKAKGFDTTSAQQDWNMSLDYVKGNDAPSPVLSLNRSQMGFREPLIGSQSVPITGFGF
jgi:hypothetical protein